VKCDGCVCVQVIEGGNYDVDVTVSSSHSTLYQEQKKQYDQYTWTVEHDGEYRFCFSNEFSTVTHKVVYFDFQAGDDDPLRDKNPLTAMTQVHTHLNSVIRHIIGGVYNYQKLTENYWDEMIEASGVPVQVSVSL